MSPRTEGVAEDLDDGSRRCRWCGGPIPPRARRDSKFCRQSCRQASHRFGRGAVSAARAREPMRFAYADPPYPGKAGYYRGHRDYAGEVDHGDLIRGLELGFPHGWALSTSSSALPELLELVSVEVRIAAWFRGERATSSWRPLSGWEPVIVAGGRLIRRSIEDRRVDALVHASRPRTTDPERVVGSKPAAFAYWLFDLLGARPGDELVDLYPGSGGISRAWQVYASRVAGVDGSR